jgi:hypothetical protein
MVVAVFVVVTAFVAVGGVGMFWLRRESLRNDRLRLDIEMQHAKTDDKRADTERFTAEADARDAGVKVSKE